MSICKILVINNEELASDLKNKLPQINSEITSIINISMFVKNNRPDIIILDSILTIDEGKKICKLIKTNFDTNSIQILKCYEKEYDIRTNFELGSDCYCKLPKGCFPNNIQEIIRWLILRKNEEDKRRIYYNYATYQYMEKTVQYDKDYPDSKLGFDNIEATLFLSDIVNYTKLVNNPKYSHIRIVDMLNNYFEMMTKIIFSYGGIIDKYIGDGILAYFQTSSKNKKEQKDNAIACLNMSFQMIKTLDVFTKNYKELGYIDKDYQFRIRIGINTDNIIKGHFGALTNISETIFGPGVNLVSRLEQSAEDNSIYIGENTFPLIKDTFKTLHIKPKSIYKRRKGEGKHFFKGFDKGVDVYKVIKKI